MNLPEHLIMPGLVSTWTVYIHLVQRVMPRQYVERKHERTAHKLLTSRNHLPQPEAMGMTDLLWNLAYGVLVALLLWLLHSSIGSYPEPLPRSDRPRRDILEALLLWGVAVVFSAVMVLVVTPGFNRSGVDRAQRELILLPVLALVFVALPALLVTRVNGWNLKDFGLTFRTRSRAVSLFAVALGMATGVVAFITNQAVIGIDVLSWQALALLLFTNAFVEEFYQRGVIQSLLERAAGQSAAILWGGILFGLVHVVFDFSQLFASGGILAVLLAVLLQTLAGWMFAIIYMKTRSLWPGIAFHYLVNWLPSLLVLLSG